MISVCNIISSSQLHAITIPYPILFRNLIKSKYHQWLRKFSVLRCLNCEEHGAHVDQFLNKNSKSFLLAWFCPAPGFYAPQNNFLRGFTLEFSTNGYMTHCGPPSGKIQFDWMDGVRMLFEQACWSIFSIAQLIKKAIKHIIQLPQ
jgi:hypothetical protein